MSSEEDPSLISAATDGAGAVGSADGGPAGSPTAAAAGPAAVDPALLAQLQQHIVNSVPPLVQGNAAVLQQYIGTKETDAVLQAFLSDPATFTLLVHKRVAKSAVAASASAADGSAAASSSASAESGANDPTLESYSFDLHHKPPSSSEKERVAGTVAFIKSAPTLDPAGAPLSAQLLTVSVNESHLFESMLAYVRHVFLPYSRAWMSGGGSAPEADNAAEEGARSEAETAVYRGVNRKLGELEVELLRFQDHIDIPHIVLDVPKPLADFVRAQRAQGVLSPRVEDLGPLASDPAFLNDIQRQLNEWKKSIVRVTKLQRDVASGSTLQEVMFWIAMERAVNAIYDSKESVPVELAFSVLRQNKRFLATTGFMQDVGLSEEGRDKDRVHRYAAFLRDLPIKRLLSATDLAELIRALELLFSHLKQIRRSEYPLSRCVSLVHTCLSRDVVSQVQTRILSSSKLMRMPYADFVHATAGFDELFAVWATKAAEFADMVRQLAKKTGENLSQLKQPYAELDDLRVRISDIRKLRKEHEELRLVVTSTLSNDVASKQSALTQIHEAYAFFSADDSADGRPQSGSSGGVNVLSITPDGKQAFNEAMQAYSRKIDGVEAELESKIREFLDRAKDDSNELFRVVAKFNPLFVRPRIQSAIRSYQEHLILTVKKDIDALQHKFNNKMAAQEARRMAGVLRDLPPVSSMIIWARQIERQLNLYMARVESVLGKQWNHHFEGRQLKRDSDDFRAKLKPIRLYQQWLVRQQERVAELQVRGPIFRVSATAKQVSLGVNFDRALLTLFKEVRALQRMDCKIPFDIITAADEARQNYPFAMRLEEVLRIYARTCAKLDASRHLALLGAGHKRAMQESIARGIGLQWLDSQVKAYVDQLATQTVEFQDQIDELEVWVDTAERAVHNLSTMLPEPAQLKATLADVQTIIDTLDKRGFSNLDEYIAQIDGKVEAILAERTQLLVQAYTLSLDREYDEQGNMLPAPRTAQDDAQDEEDEESAAASARKTLQSMVALMHTGGVRHEILIRNQVLAVEPALDTSRLQLVRHLHMVLSVIVDLPRLRTSSLTVSEVSGVKGGVGADDKSRGVGSDESNYRSVLSRLPTGVLQACLLAIESKMSLASSYVQSWMSYQALYDMDMESVVAELGTSLPKWEALLIDMKAARASFDTSATRKRFGPIVIEYGSVQAKVNHKYEQWHKSILQRFGALLGDALLSLFGTLRAGRESLEKHTFDVSSTGDIVESVTLLQGLTRKAKVWQSDLAHQATLEKLLQRSRYAFPPEWMYAERVQGEWSSFEQILSRKSGKMAEQTALIAQNIAAEDASLEARIKTFADEWKAKRPESGDIPHQVAHQTLQTFEAQLAKLEQDYEKLHAAKKSLALDGSGAGAPESPRLVPIREELNGLKETWSALRVLWLELDDLASKPFREHTDLRKALTRLQGEQTKLPNHMKTYKSFEFLRNTLKERLALNAPLKELQSSMLRPKHEKMILKELGLAHIAWADLTVGQLWAIDLKAHSKALRNILDTAQGESGLENFLQELKDQWEATRLELVDYKQGRNLLIRNWEPLFAQLADRLSDLSGMKQSPYFKAFEADALRWESKLNAAQSIFDVFIDVQRRWLSMSGTFEGSADIQVQLATQFKRFRTFDRDFTRLMRDIHKDPALEPWVREERALLQELTQYADTLNNIQKALGEYLEKQRAAFPRFYFLGDEALLELVGNAKQPIKVMAHLPKLFAGIAMLGLTGDDQRTVVSMISSEGEVVPFQQPIVVTDESSVHSWLSAVQYQMRYTLAMLLERSVEQILRFDGDENVSYDRSSANYERTVSAFFGWVDQFPAQIVILSTQVYWSQSVESALDGTAKAGAALQLVLSRIESTLEFLADRILHADITPAARKKYEQLITEKVHQRDATRKLIADGVQHSADFAWLAQARFYFTPLHKQIELEKAAGSKALLAAGDEAAPPVMRCLQIRIARFKTDYFWEYQGVCEKLVQTPLTDRAFFTLGEALHMRLGGNPFGPAGTGKTETVKALGALLGRMTLVFNCDEAFDLQAMGRIFVGLCQCGAWGCFDEFNRLEERILSAVSQQILTIQVGLRENKHTIALLDKQVKLNPSVALFITMNPGYAGRSELPDNLKQLFRGMAMTQADKLLIGQVLLYGNGYSAAEELSGKVALLFQLCEAQLSAQSHYDFGLRALKSVLRSAGNLKRAFIAGAAARRAAEEAAEKKEAEEQDEKGTPHPKVKKSAAEEEQDLLVRSICATVAPKLVAADLSLFSTLVRAVFPGAQLHSPTDPALRAVVAQLCAQPEHSLEESALWIDKIMQLAEISSIHHGVILVGGAATGKTSSLSILRLALEQTSGRKISTYVIDPKALSKEDLYGALDPTTLEWRDGVFTAILRKILDNVRGEQSRDHFITFDGDVDPVWCENLNSVLDDNKLLTLPNGERLALTPNIRIFFEVQDLNHATPATVSRCGMSFYSQQVITTPMILLQRLRLLRTEQLQLVNVATSVFARWKSTQLRCVELLEPLFGLQPDDKSSLPSLQESVQTNFVLSALHWVETQCDHIMTFSRMQALTSLFSLLKGAIAKVIAFNDEHADFPLSDKQCEAYLSRFLVFATLWAFGGSLSLKNRLRFCSELVNVVPPSIPLPDTSKSALLDFEVRLDSGEWVPYEERVDAIELEAHKVVKADVVIDTVDTARHTDVINAWLTDQKPLLLCGPPGSGKSMTLTAVLRSLPEFELVTLNFSSTTTPKLLLDTLSHYCKVERTPNGLVMHPVMQGRHLVLFCDEINLPAVDQFQTVPVITFLRQIAEHGGFWRAADLAFVKLERVQFIGACNPPTDAGRVPLSPRFLRHCPLLFVDFPAVPSLRQIYGTFNRALLKLVPALRSQAEPLTEAMIEVYTASQARFTPSPTSTPFSSPHYIYSPRELSRWVRALYEAMKPPTDGGGGYDTPALTVDALVRLWLHEALRLFQDRLVFDEEREWTDRLVDTVAQKFFPQVDHSTALARPVLFSNWLHKSYTSVSQAALREHVQTRLRVFYEEELDVKLVLFDEVLQHILRIDRVLRQPLGHLLLVGVSGGGKTVLSKFVAWMQGMSVFQIKVHKYYTAKDFDKDLRSILTRAGVKNERICFIFDESNVLDTAFLERMNALLASGEVPGLFEGQDYTALMADCKETFRKDGLLADSEEDFYRHFVGQVQRNLHIVFTMNPASDDFSNRSATSPALFNRCVIDWFASWSSDSLFQVGYEFTKSLDLGDGALDEGEHADADERAAKSPTMSPQDQRNAVSTVREAVVSTLVFVHESVTAANAALSAAHAGGRSSHVTPRHYLDFIKHYATLFNEKRSSLEEQQRHLNTGLRKLAETSDEVLKLQSALQVKDGELRDKRKLANDKLEQIMQDQREAESKRDISLRIGEEIKGQEEQIAKRKEGVEAELMSARPALEEAENAVRSIKKADLDTVSRFPSPPQPVKFALEAVCVMLGESANDWADLKRVIRRADFIKSVINFDVTQLTEKTRQHLIKTYVQDPNFAYDVVNNASKACGPLVKWVTSTINFSRIKNSVAPLEAELRHVAQAADDLKRKQHELQLLREELGARIDQYKSEYALLIAEVERIKSEMTAVQTKVDRSMALLTNLGSERGRWQLDSASFQTQISTLVGDCLLSAGFLAYVGYYDATHRQQLVDRWRDRLRDQHVPYKPDLNLIEYLSTPSQRLEWQSHGLPVDDLATENAIMMTRANRYPLLIDPSGQGTSFLMNQYKDRKILRTSFLDDAFLKALESALRFGNALLVEDVENIDPILNSVLNREYTKHGGRVMITVGDKEIDFSPSFTIFLSTRDASSRFAADLCSRVTLTNFSMTPSSLTLQCMSKILRVEREDIATKKADLLRLQGEYRVRLRGLEESLLQALNGVKGNILDNDSVIGVLETLKKEAAEVTSKMNESDSVLAEVDAVSDSFRPFAQACSAIYFSLERLADVHFLYHFSLPFFLAIVDRLLTPSKPEYAVEGLAAEKEPNRRLVLLTKALFELSYARVRRALLNNDHGAYAMRLAQVALENSNLHGDSAALDTVELEFFLKGTTFGLEAGKAAVASSETPAAAVPAELGLGRAQKEALAVLGKLPAFSRLLAHINAPANLAAWQRYLTAGGSSAPVVPDVPSEDESAPAAPSAELDALFPPSGWELPASGGSRHKQVFHALLVAKALRSDLVPQLVSVLVHSVLGDHFGAESAAGIDLHKIVREEGNSHTPFLLVSRPGFDASSKVDALAVAFNVQNSYASMAMGSPEGYAQADEAINAAMKKGSWLLLKNVHLSPSYLNSLEKRLHRLASTAHNNFRLFLTAELSDKLPANLLRMSNLLIFEPPLGLKASLRRSFAALSPQRVDRAPAERGRLYFLLAWLHAVVLERLRYTPAGWAKPFEFSETDQQCALDAIDEWVDATAAGRANVPPAKLPWDAIRSTLEQVVYGGRIDNAFDQARLKAFVQSIFTPQSYEAGHALATRVDTRKEGNGAAAVFQPLLSMPEASTYEGFRAWIEQMDDSTNPEMLGLQPTAQLMLLSQQSEHLAAGLMALQDTQVEEVAEEVRGGSGGAKSNAAPASSVVAGDAETRPAWMSLLDATLAAWAAKLPTVSALAEKNLGGKTARQVSASVGGALSAQAAELAEWATNPIYRCLQREFTILSSMLDTVQSDLTALRDVLSGRAKPNNHIRELLATLRRDVLPRGWYRAGMPKGLAPGAWVEDFSRRLQQIGKLVALHPREYGSGTPIWLGGLQAPEGLVAATRQAVAHAHSWPLEQLELRVSVGGAAPPSADSFSFEGLVLYGAQWNSAAGTLAIGGPSEKLSVVLPQVRFTWVHREQQQQASASAGGAAARVSVPVYLDATRQSFLFEVALPQPDELQQQKDGQQVWTKRGSCITVWSSAGSAAE